MNYYAKLIPVNPPNDYWNTNLAFSYYWTVEEGNGLKVGEYMVYPVNTIEEAVVKSKKEWNSLGISEDNAIFIEEDK